MTLGAAFVVVGGVVWWRGGAEPAYLVALLAGSLLLLGGLLVPGRLGPVHAAWMGFALRLSRVTTPIFLAIVYFLVITPIGLLVRLRGRNPIRREPVDGSYWVGREKVGSDLTRQF